MIEEPVALSSGGRLLPACLHYAEGRAAGVVVLCHSLAEERKCAAAALVGLARRLAASGRHVLRFDYRGCGDGPGDFTDFSLDDWREDAVAARRLACTIAGERLPLVLFGLRLGAFPAMAAAREGAERLVLWEPVTSGPAYLKEVRRRRLLRGSMTGNRLPAEEAGEGFDNEGFFYSAGLCSGLSGLDLADELEQLRGLETLLLQVSPGRSLYAGLSGPGVNVGQAAGPPFWQHIGVVDVAPQVAATLEWLGESVVPAEQGGSVAGPFASEGPEMELEAGERLISFPAPKAGRLRGVLHLPADAGKTGVVTLHGWGGCRLGENRSLLELARRLSKAGCPVLRFDFRGRGDSDGFPAETTMDSMAEDALVAADYLRRRAGVEELYLVGTCSGARIGLRTAGRAGAAGLAAWSMPAPDEVAVVSRAAGRAGTALAVYWKKIFRAETWSKLAGGRLQPRLIARAVLGSRRGDSGLPDELPGRLLLVYGGADPEAPSAADYYTRLAARQGVRADVFTVAGANHGFYALEWREEVMAATVGWVTEDA